VTEGIQNGAKGGQWMPDTQLRALWDAGRTYDQIAEANHDTEGWRPSRAAVLRKLQRMNVPKRNAAQPDLLPWRIAPQHGHHVFHDMLQAQSRRQQNQHLSEADRRLVNGLHKMLCGGPRSLVITYHPEVGFALVPRQDGDGVYIRPPHPGAPLKKDRRSTA
jgi:hypothetical protein